MAKIYLIRNEFDNGNGEIENTVKAYATHELAKQEITKIIKKEIEMFVNDGTLERKSDGTIDFADNVDDSFIEVTATKLCLRNDWGFCDEIWIEELDIVTGGQAQ